MNIIDNLIKKRYKVHGLDMNGDLIVEPPKRFEIKCSVSDKREEISYYLLDGGDYVITSSSIEPLKRIIDKILQAEKELIEINKELP